MSRHDWKREIDEELIELEDEAHALLDQVLGLDEEPQGLHQQGWEPWEDEAVEDYLYPELE